MTDNSYLCRFISEHPDDWRELLAEKNIKISDESPYSIFNYNIGADFFDPIVQEARGIIINTETIEVACWPFRKFGNWDEPYADEIDWSTARVEEKIDGSIVKLWWDPLRNTWRWSTNSVIDALNAKVGTWTSFLYLITSAKNYDEIRNAIKSGRVSKDRTYIFELVGPENQVVVRYAEPYLYHIGTRSNVNGQEYRPSIGISHSPTFEVSDLGSCIEMAEALNSSHMFILGEGFVVIDANWHRIKVKSSWYRIMHHAINNGVMTAETIVNLIRANEDIDAYCRNFPALSRHFKYYQWQVEELKYGAEEVCRIVDMERLNSFDRKQIALRIKDNRYAAIGFRHLDSGKSAAEILADMTDRAWLRDMRRYEKES